MYLCSIYIIGMEKIRRYVFASMGLTIVILAVGLWLSIKGKGDLEEKWKNAAETVKAYSEQFSTSESQNRAFKLTIDQLKSSSDSIIQQLDATRKELKVKDNKIQSLQYVSSSFARTDTITLVGDTIFKDREFSMDTLLSDDWYSVRIGLGYPSMVAVKPEFKSVKNIVVSSKRETVNPPKKFFLLRWFQKKQTVLNIDVVEKNPYVKNQTNRYVEIVR